jgi:hypothetical protein
MGVGRVEHAKLGKNKPRAQIGRQVQLLVKPPPRAIARQVVPKGGFCFHAKAGAGRF